MTSTEMMQNKENIEQEGTQNCDNFERAGKSLVISGATMCGHEVYTKTRSVQDSVRFTAREKDRDWQCKQQEEFDIQGSDPKTFFINLVASIKDSIEEMKEENKTFQTEVKTEIKMSIKRSEMEAQRWNKEFWDKLQAETNKCTHLIRQEKKETEVAVSKELKNKLQQDSAQTILLIDELTDRVQ
jgi:hypothetical protein